MCFHLLPADCIFCAPLFYITTFDCDFLRNFKKKFFFAFIADTASFSQFQDNEALLCMWIAIGGVWQTSLNAGLTQESRRIIPGTFSGTANTNILPWRRTPPAASRRHPGDIPATSRRHSDYETSPDAPGRVLETFQQSRNRNHSPENGIDRERSGAEWTRHSLKRQHQGNSSCQSVRVKCLRLLPGIRLSKRILHLSLTSNEVADTPAWT